MFSLIITIISIALVAALAIAVIYYGSGSIKAASNQAAVDALINQSTQINAAGTLAGTQGVDWPEGSPQFTDPYLAHMPLPPKSAYVEGISPATTDWEYLLPDGSSHHFVLRNKIRKEVCMAVNKTMGFNGIPASWDGTSVIQCYGAGTTVPGAYTFLYSPPSKTTTQQIDAQEWTNLEGGTDTAGYPRLCEDGTSVNQGLCPGNSTSPAGGAHPVKDDTAVPTEAQCTANPSLPACDASKYPALRIDNFTGQRGGETIQFTAVANCSQPLPAGSVCLPSFQSKHRTWQWGTGSKPTTFTSDYLDARGTNTTVHEYGFWITDGVNTYELYGSVTTGSRDTFIPVNDYPRTPIGGGNYSIDCASAKADILAKGAQFLPGVCTSINTKGQFAWTFVYDDINQFDTRSVNSVNLGMYYNGVQSSTQYSLQTYDNTDTNKLIIGKISAPYTDTVPLGAKSGNTGRWPQAPLDTTYEDFGPF